MTLEHQYYPKEYSKIHNENEYVPLTPRMVDILCEYAKGKNVTQTANSLGIAPQTVKNHSRDIYERFEVENKAAAVHEGIQQGHLDPAKFVNMESVQKFHLLSDKNQKMFSAITEEDNIDLTLEEIANNVMLKNEKTFRNKISRLYSELGISDRAEAVVLRNFLEKYPEDPPETNNNFHE